MLFIPKKMLSIRVSQNQSCFPLSNINNHLKIILWTLKEKHSSALHNLSNHINISIQPYSPLSPPAQPMLPQATFQSFDPTASKLPVQTSSPICTADHPFLPTKFPVLDITTPLPKYWRLLSSYLSLQNNGMYCNSSNHSQG